MNDGPIEFGPWADQAVEFALAAADPADERGSVGEDDFFASKYEPRISLPESIFDCIALDDLKDHPAVDTVIRAELASGAAFRLLRFPISARPAQESRIDELRFAIRLIGERVGLRVHSIFPERLTAEQQTTTEVALDPNLSIASSVQLGFGRVGRSVVTRQSRSTLVGFWSEDGAEWVMRSPPESNDGLQGTWEFLIVIHWPDGLDLLRAALSVSATVATRRSLSRWRTKRAERIYDGLELTGCISLI